MKSKKSLALVALLALSGASLASAQTIIHVTGSTAYRAAVVTAEYDALKSSGTVYGSFFNFDSGSSGGGAPSGTPKSNLPGANVSIIYNNGASGTSAQIIFENTFSGSVLGALELTNSTPISTFPSHTYFDPTTGTIPSTALSGGGENGTPVSGGKGVVFSGEPPAYTFAVPAEAETAIAPDISMSDVFLDSVTKIAALGVTPKQKTVGVVPFVFVAGNGAPASFTNMTPQEFQQLWGQGRLPLSFFSGVNADESTIVYALGRDLDSGTRATAFAESGFGVGTAPQQFYPYNASGSVVGLTNTSTGVSASGPITSLALVPTETVDGITETTGQGGYAVGGDEAGGLSAQNSVTGSVLVGYLGLSDAGKAQEATASGGSSFPGRVIAYNGYSLTLDPTNSNGYFPDATSAAKIQEGQYTYWGYEHLYSLTTISGTTTPQAKLLNAITAGDDLVATGGANGVHLANMEVQRSDDGAAVSATYAY